MSERETALKAGDELIIREGNGIERRVRYIGVRDGRKRYAVRNTSTGRLSYIHPQDPRARCASSRTPLARIPAEPTHVVPLAICMEAQRCAAQNGRIDPDYLVGLYRRGAEARTVVDGNGEILTQAAVDRLLALAGADPVPVCQWREIAKRKTRNFVKF
jgi:hypothetical protein